MSEAAKPVDVNRETFSSEVLEASYARPVLVDFWASWCGPCQMLAPMLENIAAAYGSEAVVAKVNTDEEHDLAAQYGVRALPTLKLFRDGQLVEEIMGVQPEGNIRAIIDRHLPRASDDARAQARAAREAGDPAGAAELLEQAHRDDPENDALK
ncbi:MAG: thioredoxin, partial [Gammaproteobacteria bacterium]|nr:thioredoxin [Gammaproteobacteria bacterium]